MNKQLPGQVMNRTTSGPVHQVQCAHCGKANDFRELQAQQLLDTGHEIECDHCHHLLEVVRIAPVTVVTVRRSQRGGRAPAGHPGAQPARTLSPAQTRKLLGRR